MEKVVQKRIIVRPGGFIEIQSDELPAGAEADVTIRVSLPTPSRRYQDYFGAGKCGFSSPLEVDTFVREERNAWEA